MKKIIITFAIMLVSVLTFAQVPQSFSYQAVVRDKNNNVVADKLIQVSISILQGSWNVYSEKHNPKTNSNGLFTIEIGKGYSSGNFAAIDWSNGTYYIRTETEYGTITTQLLSVPFAMYATRAGNVDIDLTDYVKKTDLPDYPDLSDYAKKSDIPINGDLSEYAKKTDLPNMSEYAKISDIPGNADLSEYAKKSDLPDLSEYATMADIPENEDLSEYAKKTDIPDISEYAKKSDIPDLHNYVQKSDIPSKMSDFENDANYVSKAYLLNLIDILNNRIVQLEKQVAESNQGNTSNNNTNTQVSSADYVDLGLPSGTLWATCNLGANKPEEYGDYYAWGEIQPKFTIDDDDIGTHLWYGSYEWMNYKYGQEKNLSKYCVNSSYGNKDDKKTLELSDDAAYVNLGIGWSIPSINDWQELKNNCLCVYAKSYMNTNIEGIIVYKYKRNADGKRITDETSYNTYNDTHIFLPYSGLYRGREFYHEEVGYTIGGGIRGMYWSNTLNTDSGGLEAQFAIITKMSAYNYIRFNVGFVYKRFVSTELEDKGERSSGYTIRAVRH